MIPSEETTAGQSVEGEYKPRVGERVRILMGDHYDEFGTVLEPANGHGLYAIRLDSGHSIKAKPGYFERSLQAEFGNPYLTKVVRGVNRTCECGEQYELRPICATCEKRFRRQLAQAQERADANRRVREGLESVLNWHLTENARLRRVVERLASPDEMGGMGVVEEMTGPAAVELRARMRYAESALSSAPATAFQSVIAALRELVTLHNETRHTDPADAVDGTANPYAAVVEAYRMLLDLAKRVRKEPENVREWLRRDGIVISDLTDKDQHAVFLMYNHLVDLSVRAKNLLESFEENEALADLGREEGSS